MEWYSAIERNALESVLMKWMNVEPVTQWSMSERERLISCINTCIRNLERWYWWTHLQGGSGDVDRTGLWTLGDGEQQTNGEHSVETYITTCKMESRSEFAAWPRGLRLGPCDHLAGREGGACRPWLSHADIWQKPTQCGKAVILQLINTFKKLKDMSHTLWVTSVGMPVCSFLTGLL